MLVDLKRMPPEGQAVDRVIAAGSVPVEGEEFRLLSNVELTGHVEPLDSGALKGEGTFRLRAQLSSRIEVDCFRCLEPFPLEVQENVNLIYLPQSKNVAPAEGEDPDSPNDDRALDSEELAVSFYRDHQIDLGRMLVEQIVLSLPMKLLCREECRGLCPECGANRNETSCECAPDESDPRWSALKTLLGS